MSARQWCEQCRRYTDCGHVNDVTEDKWYCVACDGWSGWYTQYCQGCGAQRPRSTLILPIETPDEQPVPSLAEVFDLVQRARESIIRSAQVPEKDLGLK